jgi:hypothetical protein
MKSIKSIVRRIETTYHKFARPIYLIGIVIGASLLIFQAIKGIRALQTHSIPQVILLWPLILSLSILMFTMVQQVIAWFSLMKGSGLQEPFSKLFSGYMVSFLPRYIPGVFWGYLSRNIWLSDSNRVKPKVATMGSFFEIIVGFIGIFLVLGIYLGVRLGGIPGFIITIISILIVWLSWWFFNRSRLWIFLMKFFFNEEGELFSIPLFFWCLSVGLLAVNMLLNGLALILIGRNLALTSVELNIGNVFAFASYFCLAYLIGFIIFFMPAGLGLREVSLSFFLVNAGGVQPGSASALAVIFRLMMVLAEISWLILISITSLTKKNFPQLYNSMRN